MIKRIQEYEKSFKMPHLFRDDLENIEKIIRDDLKPEKYNLETENYIYDELQEIKTDIESTHNFVISISTNLGKIEIIFFKFFSKIKTNNSEDTLIMGVIKRIEGIISKRERKYRWYLFSHDTEILYLFTFFLGIIILLGFFLFIQNLSIISYTIASGFLIIAFICMGFMRDFFGLKTYSLIEFKNKAKRPNFFVRNKKYIWTLVTAIISAIIGAFIRGLF